MINKIACTALIVLSITFSPNIVYAKTNYSMLSNDHEVVAKYEHGGKGYSAISQDCVGYSYGKWQISTKRVNNYNSTFDLFLSYLKTNKSIYYSKLQQAGGYDNAYLGTDGFKNVWKEISKEKEFQEIYDRFILETQIKPAYKKFDTNKELDDITTWGSNNKIVQAALHSVIIQHGIGGAYKMVNNTVNIYKPKTPEEFVEKLYKYRMEKYSKYKTRYKNEYTDLKIALNKTRIQKCMFA